MKGVDISHYQKGLTIRRIRDADSEFAIIKVTEGSWLRDGAAADFYREAYEMGFPVGCYCYSYATTPEDARSEAQFLLQTINGFPMPCGVFLDIEEPKQLGLAEEKLRAIVGTWCGAIREAGYVPGVYGSEGALWARLDPDALPEGCLVWVARWSQSPPDTPCDLWQDSDSGDIDGVTVDTDEARSEKFRALVRAGMPKRPAAADAASALSRAAAMLVSYLRTPEFEKGFLDYVQRTEGSE